MSQTDNTLSRKVERSIRLLRSIPADSPVEIAYSGGKDSDVILRLAQLAGIPFEAIYKSTSIDPPGTIAHVLSRGARIIRPQKTFFQLVAEHGFPSRFIRFCCRILKEYKVGDRSVQGIRREESVKRAARYREPEMCRVYSKTEKARIYLPILDWTIADEAEFIKGEGIQCHRLYYDEWGCFHPERRVGCMCCPLAYYKLRLSEFQRYPGMVRCYIKAGQRWWDSHPDIKTKGHFSSVYEMFVATTFYHHLHEHFKNKTALFGSEDYKSMIESYFKISLPG